MATVSVYNQEGKELAPLTVNDAVFGVKLKKSLVHQVYTAVMANSREPWADTKNRGEVRGGGKKPWKQKGTGRARQGSIRSPQWKGGGVVFGPLSIRNYKQKINRKMKAVAVRMGLSDKVKEKKFFVLDELVSDAKTKTMSALCKKLPGVGKTTLVVLPEWNESIDRACRNIPRVDVIRSADINIVDVLHHQYIIATAGAVKLLEKRLES